MAFNYLKSMSNAELWDKMRASNPSFASHTSKATADLFTEKGFEALKRTDINAINEFIEISMRTAFQALTVSRAKNIFENSGLVEVYMTPNGGYTQRMAIKSIKPISPNFKGLQNGGSVDPYKIRKPETSERFFAQNFDYQSLVTIQDFQIKTVFITENGVGQWIAGVMEALRNGYTIQEAVNTLEALNAAINSTDYPLQETQIVELASWTDAGVTDAELQDLILTTKKLATSMRTSIQTGAYNSAGFETTVDPEDMVMVVRAGIKDDIEVRTLVGAFNPENLTIPFEQVEVQNFGGITYKAEDIATSVDKVVYPMIDEFGSKLSGKWDDTKDSVYNKTTNPGLVVGTDIEEPVAVDPNENVLAVIAQKGLVFENRQNPYEVSPIYNPAGLYTNYWASSPNNAVCVDYLYNMVVITKPSA